MCIWMGARVVLAGLAGWGSVYLVRDEWAGGSVRGVWTGLGLECVFDMIDGWDGWNVCMIDSLLLWWVTMR